MNAISIYSTAVLVFVFTFVLVINILGIENTVTTSIGWICVSLIILLLLICWLNSILSLRKTKSKEESSDNNASLTVKLGSEFRVSKRHDRINKKLKRENKNRKRGATENMVATIKIN